MIEIIGVRLHDRGSTVQYRTEGLEVACGAAVVVPGQHGPVLGFCRKHVQGLGEAFAKRLEPILRLATAEDLTRYEENLAMEEEALRRCKTMVDKHKLPMDLVAAELLLNRSRMIFYFTADGRVDFRNLVKDLSSIFQMRIELRQIGVRDEARLLGGLGSCGRELCCARFMKDFDPVSIKMAKAQNLSMNPKKISGACGRLMCCLNFEQAAYEDARKRLPRRGDLVDTPEGTGVVLNVHLVKESLQVRLHREDMADAITVLASEVEVLERAKRRQGSRRK